MNLISYNADIRLLLAFCITVFHTALCMLSNFGCNLNVLLQESKLNTKVLIEWKL